MNKPSDQRSIVLSYSNMQYYEQLGLNALKKQATAITQVHVSEAGRWVLFFFKLENKGYLL